MGSEIRLMSLIQHIAFPPAPMGGRGRPVRSFSPTIYRVRHLASPRIYSARWIVRMGDRSVTVAARLCPWQAAGMTKMTPPVLGTLESALYAGDLDAAT